MYLRNLITSDASVIHSVVILKKTPDIPDDAEARNWLTCGLWPLMQECWMPCSVDRPEMSTVATRMREIDASSAGMDHPDAMDTT
jgi:hypothetical protein